MDPNMQLNLQQLLGNLNINQLKMDAPVKPAVKEGAKDTIKSSDDKDEGKVIAPAIDRPVIGKPNLGGANTDSGSDLSFSKLTTTTLEGVDDPSLKINILVQAHPQAEFLVRSFIHDAELSGKPPAEATKEGKQALLDALAAKFEDLGILTGLDVSHPKLPSMLAGMVQESLDTQICFGADVKAQGFVDAIAFEKKAVAYAEQIPNIDPTGKTLSDPAQLAVAGKLLGSMDAMLKEVITQLRQEKVDSTMLSDHLSVLDYLKMFSEMVANLTQTLREIDLHDMDLEKKVEQGKKEEFELRSDMMKEKFKNMMAQLKNAKLMKEFGEIMKIVGYVMQALVILFGLVFLPMAPIITILAFMVGAAMLALTASLTETGSMEKIFKGINDAVDGVVGWFFKDICGCSDIPGGDRLWRVLFYFVLVIAILIIAILLMVIVGPTFSALVVQIATTMVMTILQQSKFYEEFLKLFTDNKQTLLIAGTILSTTGSILISLFFQIAALIIKAVQAVLEIIIDLIVCIVKLVIDIVMKILPEIIKAIKSAGTETIMDIIKEIIKKLGESLIEGIKEIVKQVMKLIMKLVELVKDLIANAVEWIKAIVLGLIYALGHVIETIITLITTLITKIMNIITESIGKLLNKLVDIVKGIVQKIIGILMKPLEILKELYAEIIKLLALILKVVGQALNIANSLAQASMLKMQADLKMDAAEMDVCLKTMDFCIETLDNYIDSMMKKTREAADSGESSEFQTLINQYMQFFDQIISGMKEAASGITNAAYTG